MHGFWRVRLAAAAVSAVVLFAGWMPPATAGASVIGSVHTQTAAPKAATPVVSLPVVARRGTFYVGAGFQGDALFKFGFGLAGDVPLMCDWTGQGVSGVGVFRNGTWYVRGHLGGGPADVAFNFGVPGDVPVCGDWTGTGHASPGVFRNGTWYFRNSLTSGAADIAIRYGGAGDVPVVGRWLGGSVDAPGIFRNGTWYLRSSITSGVADIAPFTFGSPGDRPVAGDWTGAGHTTPGVFRGGRWYLRNSITTGVGDISFLYGSPGDVPLTRLAGGYLWGVDTTDNVQTSNDFAQTQATLGQPAFVGRYLVFGGGTVGSSEVQFIHSQGAKVLLIVDPPNTNMTGSNAGANEAANGIAQARSLGVPAGTALFRDVEVGANYTIDAAYIQAWYNAFQGSGYVPGFYENPITGPFGSSFCGAVGQQSAIAGGTALWSNQPEPTSDPRQNAMPGWTPREPPCPNVTVAWQYLIQGSFPPNSGYPNVDVDQYSARFAALLW